MWMESLLGLRPYEDKAREAVSRNSEELTDAAWRAHAYDVR